MEEMQRLNQAFGIGIIELNKTEPISSKIIFPAKKRAVLDLDTINKLCANKEFKNFIETISEILKIDFENRKDHIKVKMDKGQFYASDI